MTKPGTRLSEGGWAVARERLGTAEFRRRVWHIAPGLLAFLLIAVPHADPMSDVLRIILVTATVLIAGVIYRNFRLIERPGETDRVAAIGGYAAAVLGMLLLFPAHMELGLSVLAILAFGDGAATTIGLLAGAKRLPWNPEKSQAGTIAFVLNAGPIAVLLYWREANPAVPFATALAIGMTATVAAALAESVPSRINDNIRIGLTASAALIVLQSLLLGWN